MNSKKFNFKDIKGMLSRDEMKHVKGGYDGTCTVTSTCGNSGSVSCSGTICDRGRGWVQCDKDPRVEC